MDPDKIPRDYREITLVDIVNIVRTLFLIIIQRTTQNLAPTDLVRFCIQAEELDKPISTNIMSISELTVEKLLSNFVKVLQSKDQIKLDVGFVVNIITIQRPIGAGGLKITNIVLDRLRKTSVYAIPVDDEGLCCAKAIAFALAYLEQDTQALNAMRDRRRPALMKRAKALHESARIPLGPCTYQEISKFEDHLNLQIAVFSSDNMNRVRFEFLTFFLYIYLCVKCLFF